MSALQEISTSELTDAFEAGRVPDGDFGHTDHVRVAWELLRRYPLGMALDQVTRGIRALAEQRGLPGLYHATITTFYVLAIADRRSRAAAGDDFEAFAAAHPELLGPSRAFLLDHYAADTLDGAGARSDFVLPDRRP